MDIPPKSGKGKRKKTGPYKDPDQIPPGGRARERILQHRKARGLGDQLEATGVFSESVETTGDSEQPENGNKYKAAKKTKRNKSNKKYNKKRQDE